MKHEPEYRLSKTTLSVISFFFGLGVLTAGALLGLALPSLVRFLVYHARDIMKTALALCIIPVINIFGWPVRWLLASKKV